MTEKWIYAFEEGDGKAKGLLGGKGANLCEMTRIGLNVPPGFVITTEACLSFLDSGGRSRSHHSQLGRSSSIRVNSLKLIL